MPTIRDVAKLAGVAPITVSRVVNNSGYVSVGTREKVDSAVDELGYVPNMLGPSLRFKQTMTLAMVVTDIGNPFWTSVTRGVEDVAQANGYSTILCNTDESVEKQDQYRLPVQPNLSTSYRNSPYRWSYSTAKSRTLTWISSAQIPKKGPTNSQNI